MKRTILIAALAALLISPAVCTLALRPLGGTLSVAQSELIPLKNITAIQMILEPTDLAHLDQISFQADSRVLTGFAKPDRRVFDRTEMNFTLERPVAEGGVILEIKAPSVFYWRSLHAPPWDERAAILLHRLTVWRPAALRLLMLVALPAFLLLAAGLALTLPDQPRTDPLMSRSSSSENPVAGAGAPKSSTSRS